MLIHAVVLQNVVDDTRQQRSDFWLGVAMVPVMVFSVRQKKSIRKLSRRPDKEWKGPNQVEKRG